jgi:hypothetical protein
MFMRWAAGCRFDSARSCTRRPFGAGSCSHPCQGEHHPIALDAGCSSSRIVSANFEAIDLRKVKKILASLRSSRTWRYWRR